MKKRFLSVILVLTMVLSLLPAAALAADGVIELTAENFVETMQNGSNWDKSFLLTDDIDLGDVAWTPIGIDNDHGFTGIFDGGGHTISGLNVNTSGYAGLFGTVQAGATVKNVTVSGSVSGNSNVGGVVGYSFGGRVENCVNNAVVLGNRDVGGIVGFNTQGSIENCYNIAPVTGGSGRIGGIAGFNSGTVKNCYNTGRVSGESDVAPSNVGGVVGQNFSSSTSTVENCYNTGSVTGSGQYVGGVVGNNGGSSTVQNCYYADGTASKGIGNGSGSATSKSADAFASGEVAYLLQNGQSEQVWGQKISSENYPVFSDDKVYKAIFQNGADTVNTQYANSGGTVTEPDEPTAPNDRKTYTFDGWYNGETKWDFATSTISEDTTLTTKWTEITYNITIDESIENGTVTADKTEAAEGEIVTLTVTPAEGYRLKTLTVNTATLNETVSSDTLTYTFTMPASDVTVTAEFEEIQTAPDKCGNEDCDCDTCPGDNCTCGEKQEPENPPCGKDDCACGDTCPGDSCTCGESSGEEPEPEPEAPTCDNENCPCNPCGGGDCDCGEKQEPETPSCGKDDCACGDTCPGDSCTCGESGGTEPEPTPTPAPAPSTGGSSSPSTYPPTVEDTDNGEVEVSPKNPKRGDTVTVTPTPDDGFEVGDVVVKDSKGNDVEVKDNGDGTFSFTQPTGKVTIKVTFIPHSEVCPSLAFTDLDTGAWYYEATDYVISHGLMNGYGNGVFGPNNTLTRAMLAQILYNQAGGVPVNYLMQYDDVPADAWYAEAVRWATSEGVVSGYGNGKFGPDNPITREQLAVMLYRYGQTKSVNIVGAWVPQTDFTDIDEISDWAYDEMGWCTDNGIIAGKGNGILDPKGKATRAEVAAMLMRFLSRLTGE